LRREGDRQEACMGGGLRWMRAHTY